jgi:hypothetical protein
MVSLSEQYAHAATETEKIQLLSAGQAILASDMFHSNGALIGGIISLCGSIIISFLMLKSRVFNKLTAYVGIFTHGLDLAHILIGFFLPSIGNILMAIGGSLYLFWFPLVGLRLFQIRRTGILSIG